MLNQIVQDHLSSQIIMILWDILLQNIVEEMLLSASQNNEISS